MFQQLVKLSLIISLVSTVFTINSLSSQATANTMVLSETEVNQKIQTLPGWEVDNNAIARTFKFKDFVAAINFVNKLVAPAEAAGHHPDIAVSYNKVSVSLTTHDAGGITQQDFDLAQKISAITP